MSNAEIIKPIGRKAYGSIGHLPMSRMGPGDHKVSQGMARICCERPRDKHDRIIIQEKLDGSCVAVAKVDGVLHPLGRAGWPAVSSRWEQHRLFDRWVWENAARFDGLLKDGERLVGEWLAQAHGTRYKLSHEPFVAFDIMRGSERLPYSEFLDRIFWGEYGQEFIVPQLVAEGSMTPKAAMMHCPPTKHGAIDPIEGVVYRVERHGKVDFLAKYVRPEKVDGCFLPEITGGDPVWNWRPTNA